MANPATNASKQSSEQSVSLANMASLLHYSSFLVSTEYGEKKSQDVPLR